MKKEKSTWKKGKNTTKLPEGNDSVGLPPKREWKKVPCLPDRSKRHLMISEHMSLRDFPLSYQPSFLGSSLGDYWCLSTFSNNGMTSDRYSYVRNLEMLLFVGGGKRENPRSKQRSKDENKQQTQKQD